MDDFMKSIREQLITYDAALQQDINEFNVRLNFTRKYIIDYIDRQMRYLMNLQKVYNAEFDYLEEENIKTCDINRQAFEKVCLAINQNDCDAKIVTKLLNNFKQTFPIRPTMLKNIPEYNLRDIHFEDYIQKQEITSPSSPIKEEKQSSERSFIPIDNMQLPTSSIGSSHYKQFSQQNNEDPILPQSRLVSTCSTITGRDSRIDLLFKIPYQHDRTARLLSFNEDENCFLIYSLNQHKLEYLSLQSQRISSIDLPFEEQISKLGYFPTNQLYYLSTRQTNRFLLFRINQEHFEIVREIDLIDTKDYLISVNMHKNFIYYLYVSTSIVKLGKYDFETSTSLPSISFENKLYDFQEKSTYKIMDFAVNNFFISFLIQLKTNSKFMIFIHDYDNLRKLHAFELIDAKKPLSMISTQKKRQSAVTTICDNDESELLLFINDSRNHLVHCCSHKQYLIPIQVNAYGICVLNDGNLAFVANNDIRALDVQDYLQ